MLNIDLDILYGKYATRSENPNLKCLDVTEFKQAIAEYESNRLEKLGYSEGVSQPGAVAEINGYCASNSTQLKDLQDISFHNTKSQAERYWGDSQEIRKCKIIIYSR